jgi:hypothetical protein
MPSLVHDIGLSLLTAGTLGVIFTRLKIPSIAAFLLAGVLVGPVGFKQVTEPANVDTIAQLGFILLLFLIGLEIDFKKIMASGKSIMTSGLLQFPLTVLFGIAAVKLLLYFGVGGSLLAGSPDAALYIGVIIACSSTLLVVKLFQENFELDTVPGRLSLGVLIFQDIWVIIAILIQPNLQSPELGLIAMSFLGILLLGLSRDHRAVVRRPRLQLDRQNAGNDPAGRAGLVFHRGLPRRQPGQHIRGHLRPQLPHGGGSRHGRPDRRRQHRQPAVVNRDHHQGGHGEGLLHHAVLRGLGISIPEASTC